MATLIPAFEDHAALFTNVKIHFANEARPSAFAESAERWDPWALAVVAYEMLAGVHPSAGSTSSEVRNAILDDKTTPLHTHLLDAPAACSSS